MIYDRGQTIAVDANPASAAIELYNTVADAELTAAECTVLNEMLAVGPDGRWASPRYAAPLLTPAVCEARALAGAFLFGERVAWSTRKAASATAAFQRVRHLVGRSDTANAGGIRAERMHPMVSRISAANGAERIELHDGAGLRFMVRTRNGGRGLPVDCYLMLESTGVTQEMPSDAGLSLVASPNPQLIIGP